MTLSIVIAPLSNDPLRDWPLEHYRELADLCIRRLDAVISFIGTWEQRHAVSAAMRSLPSAQARNLCGAMSWPQTGDLLRSATCVIANNSGIAHFSAKLGMRTVCIFGASHNPYEWMARGRNVTVIMKKTGCSPCAIGQLAECPFDKRCLREIRPATVFQVVRQIVQPRSAAA